MDNPRLDSADSDEPKHEDEIILRELCVLNGINYDKLEKGIGMKVTKLETFFFGCPYIPSGCMLLFPNLSELRIVNQKLQHISSLERCVNLTSLWICECQVKTIEGLSHCINLKSLYLYTNHISMIKGLDTLRRLEKLWLNANRISAIEGLDALVNLKELNLAHNMITSIWNTLDHLLQLEELNLSGNKLSSFQDLVNISMLPRLHTLSICDPLYPPNPICSLCNYSTYILYHLPSLEWLDGVEVCSADLRQFVQDVVERKKQFYRMKVHHVKIKAKQLQIEMFNQVDAAKRDVYGKLKQVQKHLKTFEYGARGVGVDEMNSLTQISTTLDKHMTRLHNFTVTQSLSITTRTNQLIQRWTSEVQSGGNIRFLEGNTSVPWYRSCVDLVHSRFSVGGVQSLGISGIEVTDVVKLENRLQYARFNKTLKIELQKECFISLCSEQSYKQLLDYFFVVWKPGMTSIDLCRDTTTDRSTPCHMTNSVNVADGLRLCEMEKTAGGVQWSDDDCLGELVLCKVLVGITEETSSSEMLAASKSTGVHCFWRTEIGGEREWFIMNRDLLLPEYIIHYKYIMATHDSDQHLICDIPVNIPKPASPAHPRLAMLDEQTVLQVTGKDSLCAVKVLCLHDNHLRRFRIGPHLPFLMKLVLSFNELTTAEDIHSMPNLEYLDLSFNKLTGLNGLKVLGKLNHLDIRGNEMTNLHDVVVVLCKCTPSLEVFDTKFNPWVKLTSLRTYIIGRIKSVKFLDGSMVTEDETALALKGIVATHLSLAVLMRHAHTHRHTPSVLSLEPLAHVLHTHTHHRPPQISSNSNWTQMVTSVCICGIGLRRLSCFDLTPNLKWLCLANNALTSLEGLSLCTKLEELTLDDNLLESFPSLDMFPALRLVSLLGNKLTKLPSLHNNLEYLDISYNAINSLEQLKQCSKLIELYASGNNISTTHQLFPLKCLSSLSICDLTNNPVTNLPVYRIFIIYHLVFLRALDGSAVEANEVVSAREKMGGRLSQDLVYERYPDVDPMTFRKLDLTHSGIKIVDLSPVSVFDNLASLNLEHNSLTSFSGLIHLNNLKVLCLNHNRVECLLSPREGALSFDHVLNSLEVLHLAYNGISNLVPLQLHRIPSLRALFLQGNELSRVEGLRGLDQLTELVLDRNKIKTLHETSVISLVRLKELHMEENRLNDLSHLSSLNSLQRLYLGMNKIQDFAQLEKLSSLDQLIELSVVSNPISRRLQHRSVLIYHITSLLSLDGVLISPEERHAAELAFSDAQQDADVQLEVGLAHGSLLKVMNVPFVHVHNYRREPKCPVPPHGSVLNQHRRGRR